MQVEITLIQLIKAARLDRKAYAAMMDKAKVATDLRTVFVEALEYNELESNTIPPLGEIDCFGEEWTSDRRSKELEAHNQAVYQIKYLASSIGIEL